MVINKVRNFDKSVKTLGLFPTIRHYFNNILWGGKVEFNTLKLIKYLIRDALRIR